MFNTIKNYIYVTMYFQTFYVLKAKNYYFNIKYKKFNKLVRTLDRHNIIYLPT